MNGYTLKLTPHNADNVKGVNAGRFTTFIMDGQKFKYMAALIGLIITISVLVLLLILGIKSLNKDKEVGHKIITGHLNLTEHQFFFNKAMERMKYEKIKVFVRYLDGDGEIIEMDKHSYAIHHAALILNRHLVFIEIQRIKPKKQFEFEPAY